MKIIKILFSVGAILGFTATSKAAVVELNKTIDLVWSDGSRFFFTTQGGTYCGGDNRYFMWHTDPRTSVLYSQYVMEKPIDLVVDNSACYNNGHDTAVPVIYFKN